MEFYNIKLKPHYRDLFIGTIAVKNDKSFTGLVFKRNCFDKYFIKGTITEQKMNVTLIELTDSENKLIYENIERSMSLDSIIPSINYYGGQYDEGVSIELVNIEDLKVFLIKNDSYKLTKKINNFNPF